MNACIRHHIIRIGTEGKNMAKSRLEIRAKVAGQTA